MLDSRNIVHLYSYIYLLIDSKTWAASYNSYFLITEKLINSTSSSVNSTSSTSKSLSIKCFLSIKFCGISSATFFIL